MRTAENKSATHGDAAPLGVRRVVRGLLLVLLAGALYLIAVRREAILTDLASFAAWCF